VIGNISYQFQYNPETKEYQCESLSEDLNFKRRDGSSLQGSQVWQGQHLRLIEDYMMCLLFCNSINIIEKDGSLVYESESPDEIALIEMAKSMGFVLLKRDKNSVIVNIQGKEQRI
jgi:magnesium-transporting ATPase (P-type)